MFVFMRVVLFYMRLTADRQASEVLHFLRRANPQNSQTVT